MRVPALLGLALFGYGLLVVLRVIAHDALLAGGLSLAAGTVLVLLFLPRSASTRDVPAWQGPVVASVGAVCVVGVVGYNLIAGSGLGLPEWGILAYGLALLVAARHLERGVGRTDVATMTAWSFPLLLAPLALFALNAAISAGAGTTAAAPFVQNLVVVPTAIALAAMGTPVEVIGDNMVLGTSRGQLVLGVGLVCAGLYPMVLFLGLAGLQGWQQRIPMRRFAAMVALGLAALWLMNVVRLVILTQVGRQWGAQTLQTTHAHLGWILFGVFMLAYWSLTNRGVRDPVPETQ